MSSSVRNRGRDDRSHNELNVGGSGADQWSACRDQAAAAMCLGLCLLIGFAQTARADDPVQLGPVVVTDTGAPTPLQILPGNTALVNGQTLALIGETHPAQIFYSVPGAWMTEGSGQESLVSIRSPLLTGSGACGAFLFLEDSVPIQPAGFCDVNALFEINTEQAQAVEVVRGPGSVLYGSNALNGIVNVLTRGPQYQPANSASLERGTNDYTRAEASAGHWNGTDGFRISANAAHDGGFRADSGYDQQKLTLRLDHDSGALSRETLVEATNLNQQTAGYIYGLDAYENPALRFSNPTAGAFRKSQNLRLLQKWQVNLAGGRELEITPYARRNWTSFTQHFLPGEPIETTAVNSGGVLVKLREQLSADTSVIYGTDAEYAHGRSSQYQPAAITNMPPAQADIRPQGLHYDYAADSRTLAAYADITHYWSPQWLFSGGVRVEGARYSYENFLPAGNAQPDGTPCGFGGCLYNRPADRSDQFVNVLPKFGVSWLATPQQTVYLNVGRGARAPQVSELYELQRGQDVADLNSVTLNSFEFGWRGVSGPWTWDADAYYMLKDHYIFRDSNGFIVSNGRIRSQGLEFSFGYRLDAHWQLLADGSYALHRYAFSATLNQGNYIAYDNDVKYAPRSVGSLRLRWQPADRTQLELAWTHVGGYFLDESNQHRYGGQDLLNLRLAQQLAGGWSLALRVTNLTNKAYAERADYSFGNYRYFPGDGRETFVEVQKSF